MERFTETPPPKLQRVRRDEAARECRIADDQMPVWKQLSPGRLGRWPESRNQLAAKQNGIEPRELSNLIEASHVRLQPGIPSASRDAASSSTPVTEH